MENRRNTRSRPKRVEHAPSAIAVANKRSAVNVQTSASAVTTRASPGRTRASPVRRSSRPRSTVLGNSASTATITIVPPIKEVKEPTPTPTATNSTTTSNTKIATKTRSNLPTTLTTNTSSRAPHKSQTTASVHSSYSSATQKTTEISSSSSSAIDKEIAKLSEYIRRSVSKSIAKASSTARGRARENSRTPSTNNTDAAESRYSRSLSRSVYDDDNYSKAEFSDSENVGIDEEDVDGEDDQFKSFNATHHSSTSFGGTTSSAAAAFCRKLEVPREFGGWLGALLFMLIAPPLVYYLQWCCGARGTCALKWPNLKGVFTVKYITEQLFQSEAVGAYVAFNSAVFLLSTILFGRRVRLPADRNNAQYKFNALPMAVLLTIAAGVAEYLKVPVADFVLKHYLRFCLYGLVNAFIVAQWCFIRSSLIKHNDNSVQWNIYGRSGNGLIDYALGRQVNPKWFDLVEFKQVYYRVSLLSTLLLAECFIFKNLHVPSWPTSQSNAYHILQYYVTNIKYDTAALLTAALLLFYICDAIIFEHHLASSFELQGEGFGCLLLLRYAATPFLLSSVAKYFFERRIPINCKYAAYAAIALLLLGLTLKRISSAIKYKYRVNPSNPYFCGIETIHTFQGRRLLLGGMWGCVRQPNYTGDIIALIALGLPLSLRFAWPPAICLALCVLLLLHRVTRVNLRNLSRYHSSWVRYCSKVRYHVLPKIY